MKSHFGPDFEALHSSRQTPVQPPCDGFISRSPPADFPSPPALELRASNGCSRQQPPLSRERIKRKRQSVPTESAAKSMAAVSRSAAKCGAVEAGYDGYLLGEALLKASAAEAALLAQKAEGLSQVLGLGFFKQALLGPSQPSEMTDVSLEGPPLPSTVTVRRGLAASDATSIHGRNSTDQNSAEFAKLSSLPLPDSGGRRREHVDAIAEGSGFVDNQIQLKPAEQQVTWGVAGEKPAKGGLAVSERAKETTRDAELSELQSLFETARSGGMEQLCPPHRDCQPEELKLARTAILVCLADLRDSCIPEVFLHPMDRRLRRRRVELHMLHVRDCDVMQQLLPYMHLFELPLVKDLLPHKLHAVAQRLLFSALDMHARASESLHFPTYFASI
ncbi:hypothetical protein Efla_004262 [Eimeria flavescens]